MKFELENYLVETDMSMWSLKYLLEITENFVGENWDFFIQNRTCCNETGQLLALIHTLQLVVQSIDSVRMQYDEVVKKFYEENS